MFHIASHLIDEFSNWYVVCLVMEYILCLSFIIDMNEYTYESMITL